MPPSTLLTAARYHNKYVSLHKVTRLREAIAALKASDDKRAAQLMRAHITGFQKEFTAVL